MSIESKRIEDNVKNIMVNNGIVIQYQFIPFSQSRNKNESNPSFNYEITLLKDGKAVLVTDFYMGCAFSPSYKIIYSKNSYERKQRDVAIKLECETGKTVKVNDRLVVMKNYQGNPILPEDTSVIVSLLLDSSVLDYNGFEDWASNFGYDTDSVQAKHGYDACINLALKLTNGIGQDLLSQLREVTQDY